MNARCMLSDFYLLLLLLFCGLTDGLEDMDINPQLNCIIITHSHTVSWKSYLTVRLLTGIDDFLFTSLADAGATGVPEKYYQSLSALAHVLRDNARELYSAWRTDFGFNEIAESSCIWKVCPMPISGRWGRKTAVENYILINDPVKLATVLEKVLMTRICDL